MDNFLIWDTVSMAWTEIGLSRDDYPRIARELKKTHQSWEEVNAVILGDVVGSFAIESALFPIALVPLIGVFLITPFPDWGYEEQYLRNRMNRWYQLPRWRHYLNPVRVLGYPIAYLFSVSIRIKLKTAYHAE